MAWTAYNSLRKALLDGDLRPGESLSQVQLAHRFGVSRGPLREAIRMLQRDGLVDAEVNQRARVSAFSTTDVEHLYAMRILHESLAIQLSVPRFTPSDIEELHSLLRRLDRLSTKDIAEWRGVHRDFHFALVKHTPDRLTRSIREMYDHTDRFRSLYIQEVPFAFVIAAAEHKRIVDSCAAGNAFDAAAHLARHLARTALTVLAHHAPTHDPAMVRAAIQITAREGAGTATLPVRVGKIAGRAR